MQNSTSQNYRDLLRQLVTLIAIMAGFIVNILSNIFPMSGLTIGEISNTIFLDVLIIPANYAFAIWGLIYLGLFALGIYQFMPAQKDDLDCRKIGYLIVLASIAQVIWVYLFLSMLFSLSVVAMLLILLPLIYAHCQLGIANRRVPRIKRWCLHFPISIYLGWISIATVINLACAFDFSGWNGW